MKKVLILSFIFIGLCCFSAISQQKSSRDKYREKEREEEREEGERRDRPDLAMEQEIRRTKDPALGRVPRERLEKVFKKIKEQRTLHNTAQDTSSGSSNPAPQILSAATWVERGPSNVGGRTRAIMFDPNDATHKKVWSGGVGGGLWFTNDITVASPIWINVSDFWANIAITCITYNPANTQEFYVGTGEGWFNLDAIRGAGIWKTSDGGLNWTQLSSTSTNVNFDYIEKIAVNSSGHVFAATSSRYCNRGGVFRSIDGGGSWALVLGTQTASCGTSLCSGADLEIGADGTLYAAMGIFQQDGIYSSTNGTTWTKLNTGGSGFPTNGFNRIEIACAPSDANRLYAMVQSSSTDGLLNIYTSANKGVNWSTRPKPSWHDQSCGSSSTDMTRTQAWYDLIIAVDPNNASALIVGGVDLMKSTDTGTNWTQITSWWGGCNLEDVHADQHAIVYQPGSSSVALFGNDGGIYYTSTANNALPTISNRNHGYNVTQFYACAVHPTAGQNYFLAGAQDNGTQQFTTANINSTVDVNGGDGAFCFIDQTNPTYQIASYVYNNYSRTTNNWASSTDISTGNTGDFINPADYDDANHILYSSYSTAQIRRVSGITNASPNSPVQITISGMGALATNIRVSPYAPAGTSTLFVGTENGKLYKVTNAQTSPTTTEITGTGAPWTTAASISCVEIGASENDLLVTFSNYGVVSVWRTTDGGLNWTNKEGDLPDMPVRWAIYNPNNLNEVFLATEVGVWSTSSITAASPSWVVNNGNMANVRVDMFQLRASDKELVAATHGRGLFSSNIFGAVITPVADFSASSTMVCAGSTINFTDLSTNNPTSWSWSFAGGTPSSSSAKNPVVTYASAGTYTVSLSATNSAGSNLKTKTNYIIVNSIPTITATLSATMCNGQTTILTAGGGITYTWSPVTGLSPITGSSVTCSATANATYTVIGAGTNGCANKATSAVTVNALPTITSSTSSAICRGSSAVVTAGGGITYTWSPATGLSATTGSSLATNTTNTTTYTVAGTAANGCTNKSTTIITVNILPAVISSISSSICSGSPVIITSSGGAAYTWSPATGLSATTGSSVTSSTTVTTTYTVTGTDASGCTNKSSTTITVNLLPAIIANPSTTTICKGQVINLTANGGINYIWSPSTSLSPATGSTVTSTATASTTYTVTGTDVNGCSNKSTSAITVNTCETTTTLNLKLFIQGYYVINSGGFMRPVLLNQTKGTSPTETDTIFVELHDEFNPSVIIASTSGLLMTNGTVSLIFNGVFAGNYWVVVKHRNALETWSSAPVSFITMPHYYNFSSSASQALYNNQIIVESGVWAFYSGDLIRDGFIGVDDVSRTNNDNLAGLFLDYYSTDLSGDGFVGVEDVSIVNNNNLAGILFVAP